MEQRKRQRWQLGHGCRKLCFRSSFALLRLLYGSRHMCASRTFLILVAKLKFCGLIDILTQNPFKSHIDANQRAEGPQNTALPGTPIQYFINPIGIQSLILSAVELGSSTVLTTSKLQAFSANAILSPQSGSSSNITFPLVQGMAFVTGIYTTLMPTLQSSIFFRSVTQVASPRFGVFKYRIILEDGKNWLLYAIPNNHQDPRLQLVSNTRIQGLRFWSGMMQVAKNPAGAEVEATYDKSAGIYPTTATVTGSTLNNVGTYTISWRSEGLASQTRPPILMYALPHHIQSFDSATAQCKTKLQLQTTTKGVATAVIADRYVHFHYIIDWTTA